MAMADYLVVDSSTADDRAPQVVTDGLALRELAEATGLPESTARRYAQLFAEFLEAEGEGRDRRWPPSAVVVLQRIAALYHEGHTTEGVRRQLAVSTPGGHDPAPRAATEELALLTTLVEQQAALLAEVTRQRADLVAIQQRLAALEQRQVTLTNTLVADLLARLPAAGQAPPAGKRVPWWAFWRRRAN